MASVLSEVSKKMLEGWTLSAVSCPVANCNTPLLRNPQRELFCCKCEKHVVAESKWLEASTARGSRTSRVILNDFAAEARSAAAEDVEQLEGNSAPSSSAISSDAARTQRDSATAMMAELMLQGWSMQADECPNSCGVPLMRPPNNSLMKCTVCGARVIRQADYDPVRHGVATVADVRSGGVPAAAVSQPASSIGVGAATPSASRDAAADIPLAVARSNSASLSSAVPFSLSGDGAEESKGDRVISEREQSAVTIRADDNSSDDSGSAWTAEEERAFEERRRRRDAISAKLGKFLLQGWTMMGEVCSEALCGAPLMRPKASATEPSPQPRCVACVVPAATISETQIVPPSVGVSPTALVQGFRASKLLAPTSGGVSEPAAAAASVATVAATNTIDHAPAVVAAASGVSLKRKLRAKPRGEDVGTGNGNGADESGDGVEDGANEQQLEDETVEEAVERRRTQLAQMYADMRQGGGKSGCEFDIRSAEARSMAATAVEAAEAARAQVLVRQLLVERHNASLAAAPPSVEDVAPPSPGSPFFRARALLATQAKNRAAAAAAAESRASDLSIARLSAAYTSFEPPGQNVSEDSQNAAVSPSSSSGVPSPLPSRRRAPPAPPVSGYESLAKLNACAAPLSSSYCDVGESAVVGKTINVLYKRLDDTCAQLEKIEVDDYTGTTSIVRLISELANAIRALTGRDRC